MGLITNDTEHKIAHEKMGVVEKDSTGNVQANVSLRKGTSDELFALANSGSSELAVVDGGNSGQMVLYTIRDGQKYKTLLGNPVKASLHFTRFVFSNTYPNPVPVNYTTGSEPIKLAPSQAASSFPTIFYLDETQLLYSESIKSSNLEVTISFFGFSIASKPAIGDTVTVELRRYPDVNNIDVVQGQPLPYSVLQTRTVTWSNNLEFAAETMQFRVKDEINGTLPNGQGMGYELVINNSVFALNEPLYNVNIDYTR